MSKSTAYRPSRGTRRRSRAAAALCAGLLLAAGCGQRVENTAVSTPSGAPATPSPSPSSPPRSTAPAASPGTGGPATPTSAPAPSDTTVGARLTPGPIAFPDGFMTSVRDYGAKGDGRTDDTGAILRALRDGRTSHPGDDNDKECLYYYGRPKSLYFPAGTYVVSGTLSWAGCAVTLQGQGSTATVIRLADGAPGFGDAGRPKPVIRTTAGNTAFRHYIRDLAVDVGTGNAGAVALDYVGSNQSAVRNVHLRGGGSGLTGLAMEQHWAGPLLVEDVKVTGFDHGISLHRAELGPVLEHVTVENQRRAGIRNESVLTARSLRSVNAVPAVQNIDDVKYRVPLGQLTLVDSELTGGRSPAAIESVLGVFLRNVRTSGYRAALRDSGKLVGRTTIDEYASSRTALHAGRRTSLALPVRETPEPPPASPGSWVMGTQRTTGHQESFTDAIEAGKRTVYLQAGAYLQYNQVRVEIPASVRHIRGFHGMVNGHAEGRNGGGFLFVVEDGTEPLVIEGFSKGIRIEHRGRRPVALVDGQYRYTSVPGAGDLYLEDVILTPLHVRAGQQVWARQYNNEGSPDQPKIINEGTLWILGLKTERAGTVLDARPGSRTEILGSLNYTTKVFTDEQKEQPAFLITDAALSMSIWAASHAESRSYPVAIREVRGGVSRDMAPEQLGRRAKSPLYVSGG